MSHLAKDVLVVDDDEHIRNLIAFALTRAGLTVDTAADGLHALEHLTERTYAVLLLDLSMPRMDGPGVLKEIRAFHREGDEKPIILVLTAATEREPLAPVAEMVQAVITKPFDVHELRALVQDCVLVRQRHAGMSPVGPERNIA
ncbi:MAG TPA: response regulator [Thermoanaerobaculia bacterium]|nr:response regulator [Thermoanaerobaculia bacterium]